MSRATNITTATTTLLKSGGGFLRKLIINKPVASATIGVFDGLTAVGPIGTVTFPATLLTDPPYSVEYNNVRFSNGLCIVTSHSTDITVIWD